MSSLRVQLFGRMEFSCGGQPLPSIPTSAARSFLAYLIVHHGRPFPRDLLAGTFWPDRPDTDARRALSQAIWHVRLGLGPAANRLVVERDTVLFSFQPGDWLDIDDFEERLRSDRQARTVLPPHDLPTHLADLREAVALYRADVLEGCYDDWVLPVRERLRERFLGALERLTLLSKQWGDNEQALAYAQQLVAADPLREEAHRELLRLYHLLGRERAALEQYTALRQLLQDELGVAPDAATTALYQEILAATEQAGLTHLPVAPAPPALGDLGHLLFVGRAKERATLLEALQAATRGHSGIVLVDGAAGTGKTRLVEEIIADARWRGLQVGLGRAVPLAGSAPYQALRDAISPLLTPLRIAQLAGCMESRWLSSVASLFPAIPAQLPDLPDLPPLASEQEQRRLWEGLARTLAGLAGVVPLLLVLEDLHWTDEATLAALPMLAAGLPTASVLLLLTCRTAEARERPTVWRTLQRLDQDFSLQRVDLAPFQPTESAALILRALGTGQNDVPASAFARSLQERTEGNALFIVETLKALLEQGGLSTSPGGGWQFPPAEGPWPTPTSIQDLVGQRLRRLPPGLRRSLDLAAVLGKEADYVTLARADDVPPGELTARLEELCRRGFLGQTESGYSFEHDVVRTIVYQAMAPARRTTWHRHAGEALEHTHPERVEALAYHFDRGQVGEKALIYTVQSGERAQVACDYRAALDHYERALAWARDNPAARWDILAQRERVLDALGQRHVQAEDLGEMLALADTLGDPLRRARTLNRQGWLQVQTGDPTQALALLDEAVRLSRAAGDLDLLGNSLTGTARAWWRMGNEARCQEAIAAAQPVFQEAGNRQGESQLLNMLGSLHVALTGDYAQALGCFERSRALCQSIGARYYEAVALLNAGIAHALLGQFQRSQELLAEADEIMARVGTRDMQGVIRYWQGANHHELGHLDAAQVTAEEALEICREVGNRNFEIEAWRTLGLIALDRYDLAQAQSRFEQAAEVARSYQQIPDLVRMQAHLSLVLLYQGRPRQAQCLSAEAISGLEQLGGRLSRAKDVHYRRYQVLAATEGPEAARPALDRAHQHLMEMADRIQDSAQRRSFLENIAINRDIRAAYESGRPLPTRVRVRLPCAAAPGGRPLRDGDFTAVTWTVAAPEDDTISDPVEQRRHVLLRLLQEAAAQGAAPTVPDLASALQAAPRTTKRDLAALRAAGHPTPTRGRRK